MDIYAQKFGEKLSIRFGSTESQNVSVTTVENTAVLALNSCAVIPKQRRDGVRKVVGRGGWLPHIATHAHTYVPTQTHSRALSVCVCVCAGIALWMEVFFIFAAFYT